MLWMLISCLCPELTLSDCISSVVSFWKSDCVVCVVSL